MDTLGQIIFAVLLNALPTLSDQVSPCVHQHRAEIAAHADAAWTTYGVPPAVILVVALFETHWGCDRRSGGGWGAPINATHRHIAGTPDRAARILRRSFDVCGSWEGAVSMFRMGLCVPPEERHVRYVATVMRWAERVQTRAHRALPDHFRRGGRR